jgi:hypothetical protein
MKPFLNVAGNRPRRSVFDNSYYKIFDCKLGQLIPVMCDYYLPGDHVSIGVEALIRANPLIAPLMHRIDMKYEVFAVPIRLLWPKPDYKDDEGNSLGYIPDVSSFEDFITGGVTGKLAPVPPKWMPDDAGVHSLWDYFGFPLGVKVPIAVWPKRAYNIVYNEYYRAQDFEDPVDLDDEALKLSKWEKDYFTSALINTQRGVSPSVPISGQASATFVGPWAQVYHNDAALNVNYVGGEVHTATLPDFRTWLNKNNVDMSSVGTFDENDLRWIRQIQRHLELSMRAGSRIAEHTLAHWGVNMGDARINRPEFVGSVRSPVIISEVLQTSETTSQAAQGTMAGHGISTSQTRVGSYYCREHTIILGIMRLMPKPVYQQGINRQWLYETRFDYPTPELVNLGEQEIFNMELCATNNEAYNRGILAYQQRYDEHRVKNNMVCGMLRDTSPAPLPGWSLARIFDPANPPAMNLEFLEMVDDQRYSAVQSMPGWIVTFGNRIRRVAPLPMMGIPH